MKYRVASETILLLHLVVVLIAVFGFLFPSIQYLYIGILLLTLISDLFLGYCILSKWEFDLRRKSNPTIDYNYTWTSYYTYKLTRYRISDTFYWRTSIVFLVVALAINLYPHY